MQERKKGKPAKYSQWKAPAKIHAQVRTLAEMQAEDRIETQMTNQGLPRLQNIMFIFIYPNEKITII